MSPLTEPTRIVLRNGWQPMDPDAAAYITAVETADGQALEEKVKIAIDNFVLGCKADGIWSAIKASCILAGARTLSGALVPLAGAAPTNYNFASGDYNRKTGLVGDGSAKYLDSNRNNDADSQNNRHMATFANMTGTQSQLFIGGRSAGTGVGASFIGYNGTSPIFRNLPNADTQEVAGTASTGVNTLFATTRSSNNQYTARVSGTNYLVNSTSTTPNSISLFVFAQNNQNLNPSTLSDARIAFYSIGEALDLAKLDARVTDLINKFAEVIP